MTEEVSQQHIDHQRWLLNNNFINDLHKDTLYMYGALVNISISAVELDIDALRKKLHYKLYLTDKVFKVYNKYLKLTGSSSIIDLWRLRRILRKYGNFEFGVLLSKLIGDYCGPLWKVTVEVHAQAQYIGDPDGLETLE